MKNKKYLSIAILLVFLITNLLVPMSAEAGALKVAYKVGDEFVEASIKAIEARKGFKVVEGGAQQSAGQVFTNSLKKGLQEVADDTFNTISGARFEATPLNGMPGWLKVTLGTTAFITSADLVLDAYDYFSDDANSYVEVVMPADYTSSNVSPDYTRSKMGWTIWHEPYTDEYGNSGTYYKITNPRGEVHNFYFRFIGGTDNGYTPHYYIDVPYADGSRVNAYVFLSPQNGWYYKYYTLNPTTPANPYASDTTYGQVATVSKPLASNYSLVPVPEIDTTKDYQILIVPDPAYHPNLDEAIQQNWAMVSDPETFLAENPDVDPDAGEPGTDPATGDLTEVIGWLSRMYDQLVGINTGIETLPERMPQPDPVPEPVPQSDLDMNPLLGGHSFKDKFPFSIPWDVLRVLGIFNVEAVTPKFEVNIPEFMTVLNTVIPLEFTLDFSMFDTVAKITRWFFLIIFDIALIMLLRRVTPD